ncbi:MAG: HYR domain-containing protein [Planctomycetes bacterium]|nr:HYR domain-containing protein [Planctomycetota bacterium]
MMKKRRTYLLLGLSGLLLTWAALARAAGDCITLFNQPVLNQFDRGSFSERGEAGGFPQQLADDFKVTSSGSINHVNWSGSYFTTDLPTSTTSIQFRIRFFNDNGGGSPQNNPVNDQLVAASVTWSGVIFEGRKIYSFGADLPTAFSATAGVLYWISILEEDSSTSGINKTWRWANSATTPGAVAKFRSADGAGWSIDGGIRGNKALQLLSCPVGPPPNAPPTVSCPVATTIECSSSAGGTVTLQAQLSDADNDPLTVRWLVDNVVQSTQNLPGGSTTTTFSFTYALGAHTVVVKASDGKPNSPEASCGTMVTVRDTTPPVIVCADDVHVSTDPGQCLATHVNPPGPQVSDDCGPVTLTRTPSGTTFQHGTTPVVWTVTDASGNSAACSQSVIVEDHEPPTITCRPLVTVATDPGLCKASNVELGTPIVSDNCEVASVTRTPTGTTFEHGLTVVTWTAKDDSGNSASCEQMVLVVDQEAPKVSCSVATSVLWPPNHDLAGVGLAAGATDNCTASPALATHVFADENDEEATGDGAHSPDAKDPASGSLRLRAERKGNADGRVYLILTVASDEDGNVGFHACTVVVPHSQKPSALQGVLLQAAAAEALAPQFAAFVQGAGPLPAGYFQVGEAGAPVLGPKQ